MSICQRFCARFRGSVGYESCRGVPDASLAVHFGLKGEKSAYYSYDCFNSEIPVSTIKYCTTNHKNACCVVGSDPHHFPDAGPNPADLDWYQFQANDEVDKLNFFP